ncbi:hypothetical protein [uncultured Aquimarina sp.]|uniref:hypothetical protein n=1 Tax=uncultured Aquimarina sp. TaxID=575652 RepID=UPI002623E725|nr:hypothetical protein [uncultured Aquimarina sp.]
MKKVFLGLFVAGTMMSFTSPNEGVETEVLEDFACTISGSGYTVTADSCQEARVRWEKLLESEKQ